MIHYSLEAAEKIFNTEREKKKKADAHEVNADIIGKMYDCEELLGAWHFASEKRQSTGAERINMILQSWIDDPAKAELLEMEINRYGCREHKEGFREGFNLALNIIIQGMRFPSLEV